MTESFDETRFSLWPNDDTYYFTVVKLRGGYFDYVLRDSHTCIEILKGRCKAVTIGDVRKKIIAKLERAGVKP